MAATDFATYDMSGIKESFANWISNISPEYTPFGSMTRKEGVRNTHFNWQEDALAAASTSNAHTEGSDAAQTDLVSTAIRDGYTQILRKTIYVTDTSNAVDSYGRGRELMYQLEKAGKELKRDLEVTLLSDQATVAGNGGQGAGSIARRLGGFVSQVSDGTLARPGLIPADPNNLTTAELEADHVVAANASNFEEQMFALTRSLYIEGSEANVIMYHPSLAGHFAALQETSGGQRQRVFENTKEFVYEVNSVTDPLGQVYKLMPNRFTRAATVYVFNPKDWTQMVLRAPKRIQLAKTGSAEKWMIEMEVGLRHSNRMASGTITVS